MYGGEQMGMGNYLVLYADSMMKMRKSNQWNYAGDSKERVEHATKKSPEENKTRKLAAHT